MLLLCFVKIDFDFKQYSLIRRWFAVVHDRLMLCALNTSAIEFTNDITVQAMREYVLYMFSIPKNYSYYMSY